MNIIDLPNIILIINAASGMQAADIMAFRTISFIATSYMFILQVNITEIQQMGFLKPIITFTI